MNNDVGRDASTQMMVVSPVPLSTSLSSLHFPVEQADAHATRDLRVSRGRWLGSL